MPDQVDKDDDLDIELETPRKKGGSCWAGALLVVIILAILVGLVIFSLRLKQQNDRAAQVARAAQYDLQVNAAGGEVLEAEQAASQGNMGLTVGKLDEAAQRLATVASQAMAANDSDYALRTVKKREQVVRSADIIRQKNEELKALAAEQIEGLRNVFGPSMAQPAAPPAPAQPAPAPTPATPPAGTSPAPAPAPLPAAPPAATSPAPAPAPMPAPPLGAPGR